MAISRLVDVSKCNDLYNLDMLLLKYLLLPRIMCKHLVVRLAHSKWPKRSKKISNNIITISCKQSNSISMSPFEAVVYLPTWLCSNWQIITLSVWNYYHEALPGSSLLALYDIKNASKSNFDLCVIFIIFHKQLAMKTCNHIETILSKFCVRSE